MDSKRNPVADIGAMPNRPGEVRCPRCGHQGPLEDATTSERSGPLGATGGILEVVGLGLMYFGSVVLGLLIMLVGAALMLTNVQTPTGSCASCKTAFAQDWKGSWFPRA